MRTKSILWAAMSMTAALVMTSCSSDDVQDWPTPTTKTIPYTVTVSQGTRSAPCVSPKATSSILLTVKQVAKLLKVPSLYTAMMLVRLLPPSKAAWIYRKIWKMFQTTRSSPPHW